MQADRDHRGVCPPLVCPRAESTAPGATASVSRQSAPPHETCSIPATHQRPCRSGHRRLRASELGVLPSNEREQESLARFARLPSQLDGCDRVAPRPHVEEDLEAGDAPTHHRGVVSRRARRQVFERAVRGPSSVLLPRQEDLVQRRLATKYVGDADHAARAGDAVVGGYRPTKPTSAKLLTHASGIANRDVRQRAPAGGNVVSRVRLPNVARRQDVARTRSRRNCWPRGSYCRHQPGQPEREEAQL